MVTIIKKGTSKEEIKKQVNKIILLASGTSLSKFAGALKLAIDPLEYQKKMRDEWN